MTENCGIRPHLSESASITLTQRLNAMTVTDRVEKLDQVGKVLSAFDTPPRGFTFAVKLVRARADVPEGSIAREIGGLGLHLVRQMADTIRYEYADGRSTVTFTKTLGLTA